MTPAAVTKEITERADEGEAGKGRRHYELKRTGPEGKAGDGGEHWFLVRPLKEGMPCGLVFADKDGMFKDILVLEWGAPNGLAGTPGATADRGGMWRRRDV